MISWLGRRKARPHGWEWATERLPNSDPQELRDGRASTQVAAVWVLPLHWRAAVKLTWRLLHPLKAISCGQSPPLPSPSIKNWVTHTSNRNPLERRTGCWHPEGEGDGTGRAPRTEPRCLVVSPRIPDSSHPSPSTMAISNQPIEQRRHPVDSSLATSCGGTWPNRSPLWGICHRRWRCFVASVFYFSKVPRDSDIRSVTRSTVRLLGPCCSCLSSLSFLMKGNHDDKWFISKPISAWTTARLQLPFCLLHQWHRSLALSPVPALQQPQSWKGPSTNHSTYGLGCWVRGK